MNAKVIDVRACCKLAPTPRRSTVVRVMNVARRHVETPPVKRNNAVLTEAATCSVDRKTAHQFNQCWLNFDQLDEDGARSCLVAVDKILEENCDTEICDEELCSDLNQVDWFKRYVSNAFGLNA